MNKKNYIDYVVIPARGGSKRIPHKNLALFNGKPMLEIAINLAKEVSKNVIISSEDSKILNFAKNLKVDILEREKSLADDFTPTLPVIIDTINRCNIESNKSVLCLYPTAMFATKSNIFEALELLMSKNVAYIVPVIENAKVMRSFTLEDSKINFIFKEFMNTRSQDLKKTYNDAGQFYLGFAKSFLQEIPLLGESSHALEIQNAWDIDTPNDLKIAEMLAKINYKETK
ncbi:pseudaminic acid cytidylyltransferase [Helicobacter saguini]|uniref:Pseudaminic acid cytidylyltransferase n=1 Tax=Helicobacter saguini TaxID=1548018 RepID=A0A347VP99_9HELI|nr:hypothetical protein [Helicobacter saguini]MWV61451.1 pseudaminic acid cytidylyltransferase [Helicobacter saguini]MWV67878.1 pseudaminic acid cytidylyltransferase [Helicobacter saguini]MWV70653.1 pseudaminic acid cytidylyltransferase [Helicobacter saguini]MWV72558.1 pseudaminic acid cytidylyltransferase [Helicobacter saguini]TLD94706.1 pseudaminic acid cytidylyltransferase [Helicobacter saguini]